MLFNSWDFCCLLLITLGLYYLPVPRRRAWQICLLLVSSGLFYAWGNYKLLTLLAFSCALNTYASERIIYWKFKSNDERNARRWLVITVGINLMLLAFFKYAGFIVGNLPSGLIPEKISDEILSIPLPIGISFYTFQGISLVVDVFRREINEEQENKISGRKGHRIKAFADLSFYIAFFPQLVAGPIVKARDFISQIGSKNLRDVEWCDVIKALILGYFLKIVIADNLSEQTVILSTVWLAQLSPPDLIVLLYAYSFQIFADFAGYSLIAIGLAGLFGYKLPINFNFPYIATSVTEFWRRWHISLSSWLRDYLYFPLGGNKKGSNRTYFNLFLVMFLGGLWHGAAWKFAIWGILHGVLLAVERFVFRFRKQDTSKSRSLFKAILGWFYTFNAVTLLWLTFMMPDLNLIILFFDSLSKPMNFHAPSIFISALFGTFVIGYHFIGWLNEHHGEVLDKYRNSLLEGAVYGLLLFLCFTNPGSPQGFIYFQF